MIQNYTKKNQESASNYTSYDDTEDIVDFLKNPESFRTFDKGLIELLKRNGYPGDTDNLVEMSKYLFSKLRDIHSTITKKPLIPGSQVNTAQKLKQAADKKYMRYVLH